MALEIATLLTPLGDDAPCGPDLGDLPGTEVLREAAAQQTAVDWQRHLERTLALAGACRDLRAWVWLTRASFSTDGFAGLAQGLELIAQGLDTYWDVLPPQDPEEGHPRERFVGRFSALSGLGMSSALFPPQDLATRRDVFFLAQEIDLRLARGGAPNVALRGRILSALDRIEVAFRTRMGNGFDPQVGFELLRGKLAVPDAKEVPAAGALPAAAASVGGPATATSRDDVVRLLDAVLAYYRAHEPASPVPLLVARAKRLVPMSFVEAMRDLAPGGMKELAAVAGLQDDKK